LVTHRKGFSSIYFESGGRKRVTELGYQELVRAWGGGAGAFIEALIFPMFIIWIYHTKRETITYTRKVIINNGVRGEDFQNLW
jgi:hypothetical protein